MFGRLWSLFAVGCLAVSPKVAPFSFLTENQKLSFHQVKGFLVIMHSDYDEVCIDQFYCIQQGNITKCLLASGRKDSPTTLCSLTSQNLTEVSFREELLFYPGKFCLLANWCIVQFMNHWKEPATFFFFSIFLARLVMVNWPCQIYCTSYIQYMATNMNGCLLVWRFFFFLNYHML